MIVSRKKRLIIIIISLTLVLTMVTSAIIRVANYYEKAIPCEDFFDKPDRVTVYSDYIVRYDKNERCKKGIFQESEKLKKKEIDQVYEALMVLFEQCDDAYCTNPGFYETTLNNIYGADKDNSLDLYFAIEFHYNRRRAFECRFDPDGGKFSYYVFLGEYDSVLMLCNDYKIFELYGCKNGVYYECNGSVIASAEGYDAFWSVVKSCIE